MKIVIKREFIETAALTQDGITTTLLALMPNHA